MKTKIALLTSLSLLPSIVSAIPTVPQLTARDKNINFGPGDTHVFNKTGNLFIHVGDKKVNWGSWYPSYAAGLMHQDSICPIPGQCYPGGFTRPSTFVDTSSVQGSVTVKPFSSNFDTQAERDRLLAALGKAMQITIGQPKLAWASNCVVPYGACDPAVKQWHTATRFEVATVEPGKQEGSSVGLQATFDRGTESGFCAEALSLFAGLGGLADPFIGEGLSLGTLLCDA